MTTTTTLAPTIDEVLAAVERIRAVLEQHTAEAESERHLSDASYDAMIDAGLFRLLVPRAFGGYQFAPVDAYRVWEAVSRIDSAAGWCLQISAAAGEFPGWLPAAGASEVYDAARADTVFAGVFFPPATAVRVSGGWRLTGRHPFASGSLRATWFMVPCIEMDGDQPRVDAETGQPAPMIAAIPRRQIDVLDTWHTVGMRGTGSHDIVVDDVLVPDERIAPIAVPEQPNPAFDPAMVAISPWPGVHGETVVSLGVASAAIDKLVRLAQNKVPAFTTKPLREREMAQHHVAKAQALVDSARAFLFDVVREAYAEAAGGRRLSERTKVRNQLAVCLTAENCADAVRLVHEAAGTSGIRTESGFERHLRDAYTLTQHGSKSYGRYEDAGKLLLGVPSEWLLLNL
jgi:alkylation response protein AidB-like acyl-CoA dehydrogenase